jgi:nitrous oxidase accessory protein NosD
VRLRATIALAAVATGAVAVSTAEARPQPPAVCTGGMISPGTPLQDFVDSLKPGETGCLAAGTYPGGVEFRTPDVTLRSNPGKQVTIRGGQVRFSPPATDAALKHLRLVSDQFSPLIYASHVVLSGNEVTNNHTAICVLIDRYPGTRAPKKVRVEHNRIHDCGVLPAANHDHGIYVDEARDTVIRENLIYDNADRGVQLYPDAQGTRVIRNVIDSNGQGIIFGDASDGSRVRSNIISNSLVRHNVEASNSSAVDNIVRDNCLWSPETDYYGGDPPHSGILPDPGFVAFDNVVADPAFIDRTRFEPGRDSPCAGFGRRARELPHDS